MNEDKDMQFTRRRRLAAMVTTFLLLPGVSQASAPMPPAPVAPPMQVGKKAKEKAQAAKEAVKKKAEALKKAVADAKKKLAEAVEAAKKEAQRAAALGETLAVFEKVALARNALTPQQEKELITRTEEVAAACQPLIAALAARVEKAKPIWENKHRLSDFSDQDKIALWSAITGEGERSISLPPWPVLTNLQDNFYSVENTLSYLREDLKKPQCVELGVGVDFGLVFGVNASFFYAIGEGPDSSGHSRMLTVDEPVVRVCQYLSVGGSTGVTAEADVGISIGLLFGSYHEQFGPEWSLSAGFFAGPGLSVEVSFQMPEKKDWEDLWNTGKPIDLRISGFTFTPGGGTGIELDVNVAGTCLLPMDPGFLPNHRP